MYKLILSIFIIFDVLIPKVIYESAPFKKELQSKSQKTKSSEKLEEHKVNYFKLMEKLGLDYIVDWKSGINKDGDTVKYIGGNPYDSKINLKKFKELQKLGLSNYTIGEAMPSHLNSNQISKSTLAFQILASEFIFIGTVQGIEETTELLFQTKITVKTDRFLKGSYYFNPIPDHFIIYSEYSHKHITESNRKVYDESDFEKILEIGKKYLFFCNKSLHSGPGSEILNGMNVLENRMSRIFLINGNKIEDPKWEKNILREEFWEKDLLYKNHTDVNKLIDYIMELEKVNETEIFYDIDF